jgi:crotonobetainyl-CoA:carnitine CoA-transferase CaiB-like acyl-CoA transferase
LDFIRAKKILNSGFVRKSHFHSFTGAAPAVGEGAYELLKSLSFSDREIEELKKEKILVF